LGVDVWILTIDTRIENSSNNVYQSPLMNSGNKTMQVSMGIKLF
jgi:hypothetical protein